MEKDQKIFNIFILISISILMLLGGIQIGKLIGYKEGQIDALTGIVNYQLIENADQTRTWEWIRK